MLGKLAWLVVGAMGLNDLGAGVEVEGREGGLEPGVDVVAVAEDVVGVGCGGAGDAPSRSQPELLEKRSYPRSMPPEKWLKFIEDSFML